MVVVSCCGVWRCLVVRVTCVSESDREHFTSQCAAVSTLEAIGLWGRRDYVILLSPANLLAYLEGQSSNLGEGLTWLPGEAMQEYQEGEGP
ncbi:hypothetical protein E2C01_004229 [Portunus trituberculatus]|uniref:Uncharacterized protein n=1 Tax=Portunus trituberculatus TaxID=210409 RepID=A0A5B7CRU8_PORTR|nr:hypothetical protein [Portunus trituberculatus]